jgi:ABC-type glycerol-3-phosphate transport system substrate-binding protein
MKKLLAIILALLMVLSLFACGGTKQGASPSPSAASPSSSPSSAASSQDGSAPPASSESSVYKEDSIQPNTGKYGDQPLDKVGFYDPN